MRVRSASARSSSASPTASSAASDRLLGGWGRPHGACRTRRYLGVGCHAASCRRDWAAHERAPRADLRRTVPTPRHGGGGAVLARVVAGRRAAPSCYGGGVRRDRGPFRRRAGASGRLRPPGGERIGAGCQYGPDGGSGGTASRGVTAGTASARESGVLDGRATTRTVRPLVPARQVGAQRGSLTRTDGGPGGLGSPSDRLRLPSRAPGPMRPCRAGAPSRRPPSA